MPETPKEKGNPKNEQYAEPERESWSEDQKRREYYYDDAHGYVKYDPNETEVEDDEA